MKKILPVLILAFVSVLSFGQTIKQYTVGHPIYVSAPDYMNRTIGLNDAAVIQFKSEVKDVYSYIIEDNKEELKLAELNYTSIGEFYEDFIEGFVEGEEKVNQSKPVIQKKNDINFLEADISFYSKEAKTEIYYLIGVVETKTAFYKVISWCILENKAKFKADFQKILYSVKD